MENGWTLIENQDWITIFNLIAEKSNTVEKQISKNDHQGHYCFVLSDQWYRFISWIY